MSKYWLIGSGAFLAVLLIASIVVALLEKEQTFPEGSPERAVQAFINAIEDEDYAVAHQLLSDELQEGCTLETLVARTWQKDRIKDSRVTLDGTTVTEDTAIVAARVTTIGSGGPFGSSESSRDVRFTLKQFDGEWRFTSDPWPNFGCSRPVVPIATAPTPVPAVQPSPTPAPATTPAAGQ